MIKLDIEEEIQSIKEDKTLSRILKIKSKYALRKIKNYYVKNYEIDEYIEDQIVKAIL